MRCARRAGILFRKITSVQKKGAEWICVGRKEAKGKKREEKAMRKRIFAAFVCLCMLMALVPSMAYANDTVYTGGLCEHHTKHDDACGYSEATTETPCTHEHTEDCYTLVTNCVHEHTAECYSGETTEPICGHVCSEESGCITKELNVNTNMTQAAVMFPQQQAHLALMYVKLQCTASGRTRV